MQSATVTGYKKQAYKEIKKYLNKNPKVDKQIEEI